MTIADAIEVFVHGFAFTRSRTHPYLAEQVNGLWILRDAPGRKNPRKIEVIAHGIEPAEVVRKIRESDIGWHFLCEVHVPNAPFDEIRGEYKAAGYRALGTEWLFAHDLGEIPVFESEPSVRRVTTVEESERLKLASGRRKILPQHLKGENQPQRLYAAMDEVRVCGWVSSIPVGRSAWVSDLYVFQEHRGKGFGRALMSALLRDDLAHGAETSVLVASSDGARLYPHLGYEQIGVLQVFCPVRR